MTVLVILVGLAVSHFATGFRRWRSFDRPVQWIESGLGMLPPGAWRAPATVLAVSLAGTAVLVWLVSAILGGFGWALLALAVIVYTLGPRDLDDDVNRLLDCGDAAPAEANADAARALRVSTHDSAAQAAAAVVHAAVARWFGILFWFVVLGIPGAVLYRLTRETLSARELAGAKIEGLTRLRGVLDWPIVALLLPSLALCGDLDRITAAWREWRTQNASDWMSPALIDHLGRAIASDQSDFDSGLRLGHQMAWRVLILWLSVLSLALLAGWVV